MSDAAIRPVSARLSGAGKLAQQDQMFLLSALLFDAGLFLVTFEHVRPFGIEITDIALFFRFWPCCLPSGRASLPFSRLRESCWQGH